MKLALLLIAVLLVIIVGTFSCGMALDEGALGWDGQVGDPGCDWGNVNCEPEDYKSMCASFDASVNDARWRSYCAGRDR